VDALTGEDGSVTTYKRVVAAIRQFASGNQIVTNFDEKNPQTLLAFLDEQLEELVVMGGDAMADLGPAVVKRLKQMVSHEVYHCFILLAFPDFLLFIRLVSSTMTEPSKVTLALAA
jgi:hypothetical protein